MNPIIGTQVYPWGQEWEKDGAKYDLNAADEVLDQVAQCGFAAWEPFVAASREEARRLGALVSRHGLQSPSIYANVRLHEDDWSHHVETTMEQMRWAGEYGTRILVVNPEPINWNSPQDKNDAELRTQARAMQALGEQLKAQNQELAYHIHSPEMRQAAREFHHMMLATDPDAVGLCLDTHWIYRGAGNSEVALNDIVKLYGDRIVSLHVRQSQGGVWSESFGQGDIDHDSLVAYLNEMNFSGPLILEQAREEGTPRTMPFVEAQKRSLQELKRIFAI